MMFFVDKKIVSRIKYVLYIYLVSIMVVSFLCETLKLCCISVSNHLFRHIQIILCPFKIESVSVDLKDLGLDAC